MATTRIPLPSGEGQMSSLESKLAMSLAELGLALRIVNCLEDHDILTVRQLLACTPQKVLSLPNFGEKTLREVFLALDRAGFSCRNKPAAC